jgi:coenzyme F420-reducing hydrogenase delta subunit
MDRIIGFCCNYTLTVDEDTLRAEGLVPEGLEIRHLPCTGRVEVSELLDALADGAGAVFVAGCDKDKCHNTAGSIRAEKRVAYAKKLVAELDMDPGLVEMFFAGRGQSEPVVNAARTMAARLASLSEE